MVRAAKQGGSRNKHASQTAYGLGRASLCRRGAVNGPHDLSLEQALLGAMLFKQSWMAHADLKGEHFAAHEHGAIWEEMRGRYRAGRLIDGSAMKEWANTHPAVKEIGGHVYLMRLMEGAACMASQVEEFAAVIRNHARRRALIEACRGAIAAAEVSPEDALTPLEHRLQEIASSDSDAAHWDSLSNVVAFSAERGQLGEVRGISTGFPGLDRMTGGIRPVLWAIGGATSMGKSILLSAVGRNVAAQGYGVGEIHLEMDADEIGMRAATALAFDPDHRADNPHYLSALSGDLTPAQWAKVRAGVQRSSELPVHIDARGGRTIEQIEAAARRLFRQMQRNGVKPGMLTIDHEGLIAASKGHPSQLERANARAEGLLAMQKRLGVAVVVAGQLTKEGRRADGEERLPASDDWKYGGALTEAAAVVVLLHRRAYHAERKPEHMRTEADWAALRSREATLVIDKARGGRRGHASILMDMPTAAVWEAA